MRQRTRHILGLGMSLGCGAVLGMLLMGILAKAQMMEDGGAIRRVVSVAGLAVSVAPSLVRSCETNVQRLHELIQERSVSDGKARKLVTAILLDGRSCNEALLMFIESREPVGRLGVPRLAGLGVDAEDISPIVRDEQGLMLWMLERINPGKLIGSVDARVLQMCNEEAIRNHLVASWRRALS